MKRIQEHYTFYKKVKEAGYKQEDKIKKDMTRQRWGATHDPVHCLVLETDNGEEWKLLAFWIGYFESLRGAEIIANETDMKFEV